MDEKQTDRRSQHPPRPSRRRHPGGRRPHSRFHPAFPRRRSRGLFLFLWFVFIFGFMGVLVMGGLLFAAYLIRVDSSMMMHPHGAQKFWVPLLCLSAPMLFLLLARWSGRSISNPLAGILETAEAITAGDLSARVPENARGPFRTVEQAFNRMVAELERSDQQRRDLTADIAHDLNTPIHIIRGYLEGIADGIYEPDEEIISLLLDETNLLSRLVEDLRTLTLADSGELPLHLEDVSLAEFLGDIQTSFSGQAEAAGVDLLVEAPPELSLYADPDRLDQMVSNLVANALRSTPAGGKIILQAAQCDAAVEIVVEDTGVGIAPEDLPNIFNRFWRKDKSRDRKDGGGHGLGLAIVKQLAAAHGGSVEAASTLGEGTRFTLRFPEIDKL